MRDGEVGFAGPKFWTPASFSSCLANTDEWGLPNTKKTKLKSEISDRCCCFPFLINWNGINSNLRPDEALPKNCGRLWAEKRWKRRKAPWGGGGVNFFFFFFFFRNFIYDRICQQMGIRTLFLKFILDFEPPGVHYLRRTFDESNPFFIRWSILQAWLPGTALGHLWIRFTDHKTTMIRDSYAYYTTKLPIQNLIMITFLDCFDGLIWTYPKEVKGQSCLCTVLMMHRLMTQA